MPYTNNNKKIHDTPIWLPTNQFRAATNSLASMCAAKNTNDRYIYYLSGSLFFRYDTQTDTHTKLASPNIAAVTGSSIKYSADEGYRGNCLGATINSIDIAPLNSDLLVGKKIKITSGLGYGQEKTILSINEPTILESGVVTAATVNSITDTTQRFEINQFIGYQVRLVYGGGVSQVRRVLYNDTNTLYFYDANYQQLETWNNNPFSIVAPYATPNATAGTQTNYYIEIATLTVDSDWIITPDESSSFLIKGGGVYMLSSVATAPWSSFQYYDVLSDTWTTKTALGGNLLAALGTDWAIECITEETAFESGTATSGTARTLVDTTKNMVVDRYTNFSVVIKSGAGTGQENRIVANGTNYFEVERPWLVQPDATSVYEIHAEINRVYAMGNGASTIYQYSVEFDQWFCGQSFDYGQTRNISCQFAGQEAQAILTGVRNAAGITALNPIPTVKGTGYAVGDLFNITTGGTVGKGRVETISAGGVVETVSLYSAGINYTTGSGKATTNISGTGTGLTVNITSVGNVGRITTTTNTNYYKGDQITIAGSTAWDGVYTILAIDSLTTFDVLLTPTADIVASFSNSTTLIVDATKNWAVNEHVGKIIKLDVAGNSPTSQFRRIISNTATTITVATIVAGANGTSRYAILGPEAFGRERQYNRLSHNGEGRASGGSGITLVDSSKDWQPNQWAGYKVRIIAGTGVGSEITITSNTTNTLTAASFGFTPDTTTRYSIMDTYGTATGSFTTTTFADSTKNWTVNKWAGKRVRITAGTGQSTEATILSNTATVITLSVALAFTPDATTNYTILRVSPRSTATSCRWIYGNTEAGNRGNFIMSVRGGNTNTIDRYDISKDNWDISPFFSPQSEVINTGSSFCYDGVDTFYFTVGLAADFIYVFALNVFTLKIEGVFQTTVLQGTAHIGNLMEVVSSPDGGKFLFLGVCTSRLMYKTLIY